MSDATTPSVVEVSDLNGVRTLRLNRPDALNAFDRSLQRELAEALRAAERDAAVRAIVITGAGRAFCAGQDLRDLESRRGPGGQIALGDLLRQTYNPLVKRLQGLEKPVIAAVNGVAAGAGLSLALACDLRLATTTASFVTAFSAIGLVPDCGMFYFLPRLVGEARAFELMATSDRVDADRALAFGLVNQVVPTDELAGAAQALAERLAAGPTVALALIKRGLGRTRSAGLDAVLELEAQYQELAGRTEDFTEGVAAFVAKRPPAFKGR